MHPTDDDQCCDPREPCDGFICNQGEFTRSGQLCAGTSCNAQDHDTCCGVQASCEGYRFCDNDPPEYIKDSLCSTDTCGWSDRSACCAPCTLKIRGELEIVDDCPGNECTPRIEVENMGENYFMLHSLGSFEYTICPGDKISLSAYGTMPSDSSILFLCDVVNGEVSHAFTDLDYVQITCDSPQLERVITQPPITTTATTWRRHPCHPDANHPEWFDWWGAEEIDWEHEDCEEEMVGFEHEESDIFWAHWQQPQYPNGWVHHWWGEVDFDMLRLSRSSAASDGSPRNLHRPRRGPYTVFMFAFMASVFSLVVGVSLYLMCCDPHRARKLRDGLQADLINPEDLVSP